MSQIAANKRERRLPFRAGEPLERFRLQILRKTVAELRWYRTIERFGRCDQSMMIQKLQPRSSITEF